MHLKNFTSAETFMLLNPIKSRWEELLQYALLDLIHKEIIDLQQEWTVSGGRKQSEVFLTYVIRGNQFNYFHKNLHQYLLVEPFKNEDVKVELRRLIRKRILDNTSEGQGFKENLVYEDLKETYFSTSFGLKTINLYFLNKKGRQLRRQFRDEVADTEHLFKTFTSNDSYLVCQKIRNLGSNVFLLKNFTRSFVEKLKNHFDETSYIVHPNSMIKVSELSFHEYFDLLEKYISSAEIIISKFNSPSFFAIYTNKPKEKQTSSMLDSFDTYSTGSDFGGDSGDASGDF